MNRIELTVHAALLLIALGLAYGAWKSDAPEERRSFAIFEPAQGIDEVAWEDDKTVAKVKVEAVSGEVRTWITHGRRKPIPKATPTPPTQPASAIDAAPPPSDADAGARADTGPANGADAGSANVSPDAGASPDAAPASKPDAPKKPPTSQPASEAADAPSEPVQYGEPDLRSFPGNETSSQLIDALTPIKALRQFEDVDAETLAAMGMDKPRGTLTVRANGGKTIVFEVGETAYGTRSTYARIQGEPAIYLLGDDIVSMVRSADSRLMERRFWTFDEPDAVTIEVKAAGSPAVNLAQQARLSKGSSYWTRAGSEARVTEVEGFVGKLFDLRTQTYPAAGTVPADGDLEPVMVATFGVEGQRGSKLELARSAGEPGKDTWYARSPLTRGWVAVRASVAGDLADLLPKLAAPAE